MDDLKKDKSELYDRSTNEIFNLREQINNCKRNINELEFELGALKQGNIIYIRITLYNYKI